ncbi:hypothetical protein M6D93_04395 [Jatrophihabitans telluris]|uniref:Uncharacterized protein n=1 Tax=Jatrophihabitans telluris TaxID=2038343 RepID=A0ABY4R1Q2_9ACTN|nr:hypothetical protein [Jatrophihabitans telluris]UQX89247.1 hypothetical protein M6D93_04395 [Jatrophihabitans telluris]
MTDGFDVWIASFDLHDEDDPGTPPEGLPEFLRATFDTHGAVSRDEVRRLYYERESELAHKAVALFVADVERTSTFNPSINIRRDEHGTLIVSYNGNYSTPATLAIRAPETICEVADNLRDHVVDDLSAAWPVCPTHGFGLDPRSVKGHAVWFCRHGDHSVSAIGQLPSSAAARMG